MPQNLVAGVDEAGRGPLAGPVVAAVVILDEKKIITGLTDSKKLTEKKRNELFAIIKENSLDFAIGQATVAEIDKINILQATFLAMQRAVDSLKLKPQLILVDGNKAPDFTVVSKAIIQGDLKEPAISAASILAKVTRDKQMLLFDQKYPQYGFKKHKGYPTKDHLLALEKFGPTDIHRKTYAPVAKYLLHDNVI